MKPVMKRDAQGLLKFTVQYVGSDNRVHRKRVKARSMDAVVDHWSDAFEGGRLLSVEGGWG